MTAKLATVRGLSLEFGFRAEKFLSLYKPKPIIPAVAKVSLAEYDIDAMLKLKDDYLVKHVLPDLTKRLRKKGRKFRHAEIIPARVKKILEDPELFGFYTAAGDILFINMTATKSFDEYGLMGRYEFAKKIEVESGVHEQTAMYRVARAIKESSVKEMAFSNYVTPLYKFTDLEAAYQEWEKNHIDK